MAACGRAQQSAKPPIIGYLGPTSASTQSQWTAAFVRRLHELGWIEGSTVEIEYRWAEGQAERLSAFADELVRLKVSVIVTSATPPTIAAKRATSVIPIVFAASGDPIGSGLVASLARPGGNVTGLRSKVSMPSANGLNSCATSFPISAGWRYWPTRAIL